MSVYWCNQRLDGRHKQVLGHYSRRVVFFGINDIVAHVAAYTKIIEAMAQTEKGQHLPRIMMEHIEHWPGRFFTDEDIEAWVKTRITKSARNSKGSSKKTKTADLTIRSTI